MREEEKETATACRLGPLSQERKEWPANVGQWREQREKKSHQEVRGPCGEKRQNGQQAWGPWQVPLAGRKGQQASRPRPALCLAAGPAVGGPSWVDLG